MIDIDPIAIATDGMWSSNDYVDIYGLATWGMIVELAIVIPVSQEEDDTRPMTYPTYAGEKKKIVDDDEEVLLIIKMFIATWQSQ